MVVINQRTPYIKNVLRFCARQRQVPVKGQEEMWRDRCVDGAEEQDAICIP